MLQGNVEVAVDDDRGVNYVHDGVQEELNYYSAGSGVARECAVVR
jgi:hypothetical protein